MITNEINFIIEEFGKLDNNNQEYLVDIFINQIRERKRAEFIIECEEAEKNIGSGNYQKGTVEDLIMALKNG